MKKIIFLIVVVAFCMSCKKNKTPKLNYSKEKIKLVIADLYVAAEALKDLDTSVQDSLRQLYTEQIEAIHKVDMDSMESDIKALLAFPREYKDVHQDAKDSVVYWFKNIERED